MLIARTVPTSGRAAGFANVLGFLAAFYLHGALSILGLSALLLASAEAFFVVKLLGAAYLCYLGVRALLDALRGVASTPAVEPATRRRTLRWAFVEGLLTNALNPKVSIFYLAAFPQFMAPGDGAVVSGFILVSLHALLNALWFGAMVVLFARLAGRARSARVQRAFKGLTGVVFVWFGLSLASYRA